MVDLYILESCPYSQKVMKFLDENNVSFSKYDISHADNYDSLLKLGKKAQVPFLYDREEDVKMYESDDIINYMKNKIQE